MSGISATPDALIVTVGTSMFSALPSLRELPVPEAAARLAATAPAAKGGAEHESISWLLDHPERLEPRSLRLIASGTDAGEHAARILEVRFRHAFIDVEVRSCRDLRDDSPGRFVTTGLRQLVNVLVEQVRTLRHAGRQPAIDATGGYKPQIAYATLVGQVMQIPVYYRYQGFTEVAVLQPLPVSVDVQVWFDHLWFFDRLRRDVQPERAVPRGDPRVGPLIEREDTLVVLSPLGELMAAAVDALIERSGPDLLPADAGMPPDKKKVVFEDGNPGKHRGLSDFCERLKRVRFVTRIATYYYNSDLPGLIYSRGGSCEPDTHWLVDRGARGRADIGVRVRGDVRAACHDHPTDRRRHATRARRPSSSSCSGPFRRRGSGRPP